MSVRLRLVELADSARLLKWRNSPEVAGHMFNDHVISQAEHDRWFASVMAAPDRRYWMIEADGEPVGLANLIKIDRAASRCEWAFYLGEVSTRGKGVGALVWYMLLRYVFETLELNKVWSEVLVENAAVVKLHESFGFTREAQFRDHVRKRGQFQDVVGLSLLKREWPAAKAAIEARLAQRWTVADLPLAP